MNKGRRWLERTACGIECTRSRVQALLMYIQPTHAVIFTELFSLGLECFGEEYSWYALPREWLWSAPRGLTSTVEPEVLENTSSRDARFN